jgi:DNA-binding YbaB/EbfC family protein
LNQDMMARLSKMQEDMAKAQAELEARVAKGTAGGGVVSVEITGAYTVQSLKIDPDAVDPADVSMLEDLISAAVNDALTQVQGFHAEQSAALTGGLDLGALGLGGMPGLGGGGDAPGGGGGGMPPINRAARRAQKR